MNELNHKKFFEIAFKEAKKASSMGEVPVGAVVVDQDGEIIAQAHNQTRDSGYPDNHAERLAVRKAVEKQGDWRLEDMELYVTLEPCLMCLGLSAISRIQKIHYILDDPHFGSVSTVLDDLPEKGQYKNIEVEQHDIWTEEAKELLQKYFQNIRD